MKKLLLLSMLCFFTFSIIAQQNAFNWRVGAYGGYNIYQGDLNSDLNPFDVRHPLNDFSNTDWQGLLSYGGSLEYSSQGFGVKLLGTRGVFRANDRAVNYWNGDYLNHSNFSRSLNSETQLYDVSLLATFYSDNGRLLSKTAFVSPYLSVGFGGTYFEVFSDYLDKNNEQYYYWSDGLIYNHPENTLPPDVKELTQDGVFETNVTDAELEGVNYDNIAWNIPLAIGLKFRISDRLNANLEVITRYVNSDYLDDVSLRGNSNDKDYYGLTSLSLHYNFGKKAETFLPPTFYSLGSDKVTIVSNEDTAMANVITGNIPETSVVTNEPNEVSTIKTDSIQKAAKTRTKVEAKPEEVIVKKDPNAEYVEPKKKKNVIYVQSKPKVDLGEEPVTTPEISTPKVEVEVEQEIVETPTPIIDTVKNVAVESTVITPEIERPEIAIDTITKATIKEEIIELPTALSNDKIFTVEEQTYLKVQKTRLEVAELNEQANILLKNYDATKIDSFAILNQRIDTLGQELKAYQQYTNSLAIQGNAEYTKPENQAIEKQTSALEEETAVLRQKYNALVLGDDAPKVIETELAKIEKENEVNKAKIKALEEEVAALEAAKIKVETTTEVKVAEVKTTSTSPTTSTVEIATKMPSETVENVVVAPVVGNPPTTVTREPINNTVIPTPVLSDSMALVVNAYDVQLKALKTEVNRLNNEVIPQKDKTIEILKGKVSFLEGELKGIEKTNKYWADLFQKQIAVLQKEIAALNQRPVSAAPITETKVVEKVVEKIVEVPAQSTTKTVTLQDIVNDFGVANVYFDVGKTTIKSEFYNKLERVSSLMKQHPEVVVTLKGYTDKSGNPEANFRLSKKRAEAVKSYLIRQGVSGSRVDISYFGANTATAANDPFSRRVEVVLVVGNQ